MKCFLGIIEEYLTISWSSYCDCFHKICSSIVIYTYIFTSFFPFSFSFFVDIWHSFYKNSSLSILKKIAFVTFKKVDYLVKHRNTTFNLLAYNQEKQQQKNNNMKTEAKQQQKNDAYFFPVSCGRTFPCENYTPQQLARARIRENTTPLSLALNTIFPTMNLLNEEIDRRIRKGEDITFKELNSIFCESATVSLTNFGILVMRITSQTAVASGMTFANCPPLNSVIYLWDAQPRLNRYYLTRLAEAVKLPSFIGGFFGPALRREDAAYLSSTPSLDAVIEDCVKRKIIFATGDLITSTIRMLYNSLVRKAKTDRRAIKHASINFLFSFLCPAIGCAVGFSIAGGAGEIVGELLSYAACPYLTMVSFNALELNSSEKQSKPRRHHTSARH